MARHCLDMSNTNSKDERPILFFDIDDCLYPKSLGMENHVNRLVDQFLMKHLSLTAEQAAKINSQYYQEHNLTVIGLHKLHDTDPMLFNKEVDNALPLDELLSPDEKLQMILERFDKSKIKLWLLTNAHVTHGRRVVKLLGVEKYFEGITYCDYTTGLWPSKPHQEMFAKAEHEAGASSSEQCFFVDDSPRNCQAAYERGWQVVRLVESQVVQSKTSDVSSYAEISSLEELQDAFPTLSKTRIGNGDS